MLKEVIVKRTHEVEKRIMGDVEALKKHILALEEEKKTLQSDAKRLEQTVKHISSKHERQKPQMISCGTQIDIGLVQGNKIVELLKDNVIREMKVSSNLSQSTGSTQQATRVDVEQILRNHLHSNRGKVQSITTSESRRISDLNVRSNNTTQESAKQTVPIFSTDSRVSLGQTGPNLTIAAPQRQQVNSETAQVYTRESESAHRASPEIPIEQPRPIQRPASHPTAMPGPSPNNHINHQGQSPILIQSVHEVLKSPPTSLSPGQDNFPARGRWNPSQPDNQNIRHRMPQSSLAMDVPVQMKRGPPNISFFDRPNKRSKRWSNDGFHVVSSSNDYVMHNFKLKPINTTALPRVVARSVAPMNQRPLQPKPIVPLSQPQRSNQAVYTISPSSHSHPSIPRPYLTQGSSSLESMLHPSLLQPNKPSGQVMSQQSLGVKPPIHNTLHPIHQISKPPIHPQRLSEGQFVERVAYPTNPPRQPTTEYGPRMPLANSHPPQRIEPAQTYGQPTEANGKAFVVRDYQVSQQRDPNYTAPLPPGAASFQAATQAPPGVPRGRHPPIQSPGTSYSSSPSNRHPGNPIVGGDQRGTVNQLNTLVATNGDSKVQLLSPPKPQASIVVVQDDIVLSWNMRLDETMAEIDNYELFACQDGAESTNPPIMWKKIGIVKALPLPMACTLSQFSSGNKYHFAVRAVDDQERAGPFSDPCTISLT